MLKLKDTTLVSVSSTKAHATIRSLKRTMALASFESVKLVTDVDVGSHDGIFTENCDRINSYEEYQHFMIYSLYKHISTKFCLVIQADSSITHPELWSDEFFDYDYIGAPWPLPGTEWMADHRFMNSDGEVLDSFSNKYRVGNGGFSLRSKKMLETPLHVKIPFHKTFESDEYFFTTNEDWNMSVYNRHLYEQNGNKFAPFSIASIFSKEHGCHDTFGRHRGDISDLS